jgi:hypothetical protein
MKEKSVERVPSRGKVESGSLSWVIGNFNNNISVK